MKNLKVVLTSLAFAVLGIFVLSSFAAPNKKAFSSRTFVFNGNFAPTNPLAWDEDTPSGCGLVEGQFCSITFDDEDIRGYDVVDDRPNSAVLDVVDDIDQTGITTFDASDELDGIAFDQKSN